MMKKLFNLNGLLLCVLLFAVIVGCSELDQPSPPNLEPALSVHPDGWTQPNSNEFHGLFIRSNDPSWDLTNCQECHGIDYAGGIVETSCMSAGCHAGPPDDCYVCHGDNETGLHSNPPEDIDGNVATSARGVGAHVAHLEEDEFNAGIACESCHHVPAEYEDPAHAVGSVLPAELLFGGLAVTDGAAPNLDTATLTCAAAYCHGNWSLPRSASNWANFYTADSIAGNSATPVWTDESTVVCGSCHNLPPTGHIPADPDQCANCHIGVVDNNVPTPNIIDKTKHINGQVNVFGQEYPIF